MTIHICENCGKGSMKGNKVSHSKQRTIRLYQANLHWATLMENGRKKRMLLCTKCVRLLKKEQKAVPTTSK